MFLSQAFTAMRNVFILFILKSCESCESCARDARRASLSANKQVNDYQFITTKKSPG
jgi:hypothetical protein